MGRAQVTNQVIALGLIDPHPENYNRHSDAQLQNLQRALQEFGQVRSVVVQKKGRRFVTVAGHGITEAARRLDWSDIRADVIPPTWSPEKTLAYLAADNELARRGDPDEELLARLVRKVKDKLGDPLALLAAGDQSALDALLNRGQPNPDAVYSRKVESPVYTPTGEKPQPHDLFDDSKTQHLVKAIDASDLPDAEKCFLRHAAQRHTVFNFKRIANYYAQSDAPTQRLFEDSALVIIDFDRAIELGYVKLSERITEQYKKEYPHAG